MDRGHRKSLDTSSLCLRDSNRCHQSSGPLSIFQFLGYRLPRFSLCIQALKPTRGFLSIIRLLERAQARNTENRRTYVHLMSSDDNRVSMTVWCTLIPPDEIEKLIKFEDDLRSVNQTYEDWLVSMRGKSIIGGDTGIILDRIRILMINIGIACGMNRDLAEEIQEILSAHLRVRALGLVDELPEKSTDDLATKEALSKFFSDLRFTRDIFPEEEIAKVTPEKIKAPKGQTKVLSKFLGGGSKEVDKQRITKRILLESSNVLKRIYIRLLSPDPWGEY